MAGHEIHYETTLYFETLLLKVTQRLFDGLVVPPTKSFPIKIFVFMPKLVLFSSRLN